MKLKWNVESHSCFYERMGRTRKKNMFTAITQRCNLTYLHLSWESLIETSLQSAIWVIADLIFLIQKSKVAHLSFDTMCTYASRFWSLVHKLLKRTVNMFTITSPICCHLFLAKISTGAAWTLGIKDYTTECNTYICWLVLAEWRRTQCAALTSCLLCSFWITPCSMETLGFLFPCFCIAVHHIGPLCEILSLHSNVD